MIPSKELILKCAKLSQAAYFPRYRDILEDLDLMNSGRIYDEATDTQGFIATDKDYVFVVFRGTESIKDWMTDVKVRMEDRDCYKLHCGFWNAFQSIEADLREQLNRLRWGKTVIFTGHSLGGALAVMAGYYCKWIEDGSQVITFGQPRVGDKGFKLYYSTVDLITTRIVNGLDAVTLMPPWLLGYRHVKSHVVFIDSKGEVLIDPHWTTRVMSHAWCVIKDWMHIRWVNLGGFKVPLPFRLSAVRNHSMRDYLNALEGWKE